jgi:hypothetical protein
MRGLVKRDLIVEKIHDSKASFLRRRFLIYCFEISYQLIISQVFKFITKFIVSHVQLPIYKRRQFCLFNQHLENKLSRGYIGRKVILGQDSSKLSNRKRSSSSIWFI